jgi:Fic family protein
MSRIGWCGFSIALLVVPSTVSERQKRILNRLLDRFECKLTTEKWAKIEKVSHDTALRDIQDLIRKGILKQEESGGRSTAYTLIRERSD